MMYTFYCGAEEAMSLKISDSKQNLILRHRYWSSLLHLLKLSFPRSYWVENLRHKILQSWALQLHSQPKKTLVVDRRSQLSEKEFITSYFKKSQPVIFAGEALNWDCTQKWNFNFLEKNLKDISLNLFESPGLGDAYSSAEAESEKISASEFVQALKKGEKKYLRFGNFMDEHEELLNDVNRSWLKKMRRCFFGVCYQNFIGAAGGKTLAHSESTALFYVMIEGEKKWNLISPQYSSLLNPQVSQQGHFYTEADILNPDEKSYPGLSQVPMYECQLKKGDILFVPSWMWHQVENTTDSWGLSYSYTTLRGFIQHPSHVLARIFFVKPSFFENLLRVLLPLQALQETKPFYAPKMFKD